MKFFYDKLLLFTSVGALPISRGQKFKSRKSTDPKTKTKSHVSQLTFYFWNPSSLKFISACIWRSFSITADGSFLIERKKKAFDFIT